MESWERRMSSLERRSSAHAPVAPVKPGGSGEEALLAHSLAAYARTLASVPVGTVVTVSVENLAGETATLEVTWDAMGKASVVPRSEERVRVVD